jgi:hypothetical protein
MCQIGVCTKVHSAICRDEIDQEFEAAVSDFERWCRLLLLDAMLRAGFIRSEGQTATISDIAKVNKRTQGSSGHVRMVHAALEILSAAGFLRWILVLFSF